MEDVVDEIVEIARLHGVNVLILEHGRSCWGGMGRLPRWAIDGRSKPPDKRANDGKNRMPNRPIERGEEFRCSCVGMINRGNRLQRWLQDALIVARRAKAQRLHKAHVKYPRDRDGWNFKKAGLPVVICGEDQKRKLERVLNGFPL
jgi:hypothetical protein